MLKKLSAAVLLFSLLTAQVPAYAQWLSNDLLYQNNFDEGIGLPWHVVDTIPAKSTFEIKDGKYKIKIVSKGKERWDIQFRHRGLKIQKDHDYTVKFKVTPSNNCSIYAKIGDQKDPYFEDWNYNDKSFSMIPLTAGEVKSVVEPFTASRTGEICEFSFHLADSTVPLGTVFEFDDIYLHDPQYIKPTPTVQPLPRTIRANHLGYFQYAQKKATFPCSSTKPVDWTLEDSTGKIVKSGKSIVFGLDKDSGDNVHIIDFSSYTTAGKDYILRAGMSDDGSVENFSFPFNICDGIYKVLKYDALKFFYHNRSGISIEMPYSEKSEWERLAGHPKDVAKAVSEKGYSSNHSLDVTGGWYDAGDHGKYVVNGGISLWTLMNMYEYAKVKGEDSDAMKKIADNTMNIPESNNRVPDILDETRWQMEFMLKMQIPAGISKAGMVHHKIHDEVWTVPPLAPHEDPHDRILKPPTTSATLNLAATAAQSYRLWKDIDSTFANKCLTAAEIAWKSALANPDIVAPSDDNIGGYAYGDDYLEDEFYWAGAELFISTGKAEYLDYIKKSKHFLEMPSILTNGKDTGNVGCFDWGNTAGLGTISLALVRSNLSAEDVEIARENIIKTADHFLKIQGSQGYGIPIEQSPLNQELMGYPLGSNSFVLNQCILFAYAYDFSSNGKYFNGAAESLDYIFGRNPLAKSYVSGYGENCMENPHHRFFSYQADANYPKCPPGLVAGGPNSDLQSFWVIGVGYNGSKFPQKCYVDHIDYWSTNEVTINGNASLAWVASYMDIGNCSIPVTVIRPDRGDLNDDGEITSTDVAILKRLILSIPVRCNIDAADINKDGSINSLDLAMLKRHVLGIKLIQ